MIAGLERGPRWSPARHVPAARRTRSPSRAPWRHARHRATSAGGRGMGRPLPAAPTRADAWISAATQAQQQARGEPGPDDLHRAGWGDTTSTRHQGAALVSTQTPRATKVANAAIDLRCQGRDPATRERRTAGRAASRSPTALRRGRPPGMGHDHHTLPHALGAAEQRGPAGDAQPEEPQRQGQLLTRARRHSSSHRPAAVRLDGGEFCIGEPRTSSNEHSKSALKLA